MGEDAGHQGGGGGHREPQEASLLQRHRDRAPGQRRLSSLQKKIQTLPMTIENVQQTKHLEVIKLNCSYLILCLHSVVSSCHLSDSHIVFMSNQIQTEIYCFTLSNKNVSLK